MNETAGTSATKTTKGTSRREFLKLVGATDWCPGDVLVVDTEGVRGSSH